MDEDVTNSLTAPTPFYIWTGPLEQFVLGMLALGKPVETLLVGVFNDTGRGAQRDMDLTLHRDGEYDAQLAADQGGMYVEHPGGVDYVGFYCITDNPKCATCIQMDDSNKVQEIVLKSGQALIFDNRLMRHGRKGPVGKRILFRLWIKATETGSGVRGSK